MSRWYEAASRFDFKGNEVCFRDDGDGPAVLMVHGFPTAGCDWDEIAAGLTAEYRVIVPDLLDYGRTTNPSGGTWRIHDQADMIEALLAARGISRAHVVAHDVGDTVTQELMARQLEGGLSFGIDSVVLMNGGILPSEHRARPLQKLLLGPAGPVFALLTGKRRFTGALAEVFGRKTRPAARDLDAIWEISTGVNGKRSFARRIQYMEDRRRHERRWTGAIADTGTRMIMINGVDDPVSGGHVLDVLEKEFPHIELVRLEGIGHFPPLEAPQQCLHHVRRFLAGR